MQTSIIPPTKEQNKTVPLLPLWMSLQLLRDHQLYHALLGHKFKVSSVRGNSTQPASVLQNIIENAVTSSITVWVIPRAGYKTIKETDVPIVMILLSAMSARDIKLTCINSVIMRLLGLSNAVMRLLWWYNIWGKLLHTLLNAARWLQV